MYNFVMVDGRYAFVHEEERKVYRYPTDVDSKGNSIETLAILRCLHSNRGADIKDMMACLYFIGKHDFAETLRTVRTTIDKMDKSGDTDLVLHVESMREIFTTMSRQITDWYTEAADNYTEPSSLKQALTAADSEHKSDSIAYALHSDDIATAIEDVARNKKKS